MQFNENKIKVIAEISRDFGQVCVASVVIGPIITNNANAVVIITGLCLTLASWIFSISIIK